MLIGSGKDIGNTIDESLLRFESQDGNVDRAFHFFLKLVDANTKAPTHKSWKEMLSVVRGAGGRLLKQDLVLPKLKKTGLPIFKDLIFDSQSAGGRMHKYQHPLLIRPKRWCNGAACFTGIASVGQILNLMRDKQTAMSNILTLDDHLRLEMQFFIRDTDFTPDETLVYLRTRVTYWLFHQLLRFYSVNSFLANVFCYITIPSLNKVLYLVSFLYL